MAGMSFPNLPEIIRQAQLIKSLQNTPQIGQGNAPIAQQVSGAGGGQTPTQATPQAPGQAAPPVQAPPQIPPQTQNIPSSAFPGENPNIGPATQAYQAFQGQQAPQRQDYHPSIGRRIGAGILGAIAGAHDPRSGMETAQGVLYSPFNRQMADYQQKVGQLKEAAQMEQAGELKGAQQTEAIARTGAEDARAKAEEARRKQIEFQVEHPETKFKPATIQYFNVKKQDGTSVIAHSGPDGGLVDENNQRIPGGDIANSSLMKPGTETKPKEILDKGTGNIITMGDHPKSTHIEEPVVKPPAETSEQKNKEWDRRNQVRFSQDLQKARVALANGLKRQENAESLREGAPTAQTKSTAQFAKTVSDIQPKIVQQVDDLKSKLGPGEGRWNQMWVNKAGMNDPAFAGLDQDLKMYASAIVRVHFGMRGGQALVGQLQKDFAEAQSAEDLKARIQHAGAWVEAYSKMHPEASKGAGQGTSQGTSQGSTSVKDPMGILK